MFFECFLIFNKKTKNACKKPIKTKPGNTKTKKTEGFLTFCGWVGGWLAGWLADGWGGGGWSSLWKLGFFGFFNYFEGFLGLLVARLGFSWFFEGFLSLFVEKYRKPSVFFVFVLPGLVFIGFLKVFLVFLLKSKEKLQFFWFLCCPAWFFFVF